MKKKLFPPRFLSAATDGNGFSSNTKPPYPQSGQYVDDTSSGKNRNSSPPETSYHRHWRDCKYGSMRRNGALKDFLIN